MRSGVREYRGEENLSNLSRKKREETNLINKRNKKIAEKNYKYFFAPFLRSLLAC